VFEGRDAAGKGGTIKAITERVSPRVFRTVALPAPTEREKTQLFMQRYIERFPAAGEVVIFDRSWYNRAGVEYVIGFCSDEQHRHFLELCPEVEKYIVDGGIILIKIWLEVGQEEQERRFSARITDPVRQWKLSPMDLESFRRWYDYSRARDMMLQKTDSKHTPWYVVRSDDKRRARLNCISHILRRFPSGKVPREKVKLPKRSDKGKYGRSVFVEANEICRREILTSPQTRACRRKMQGLGALAVFGVHRSWVGLPAAGSKLDAAACPSPVYMRCIAGGTAMLRQLLVGLPSAPAISGSRSGDDGGGLGGAAKRDAAAVAATDRRHDRDRVGLDGRPCLRGRRLGAGLRDRRPMTAMNGVLLFGWSTAVIFEVLRRTVRVGVEAVDPNVKGRKGS
jgi:polyphosphate kinase